MSDHSISIVPKQLHYACDQVGKAEEILRWLVEKRAIEPELSDCALGDMAHRLLPGMTQFLKEPQYFSPNLQTLGLHIITEKHVFYTIENGIDRITCPRCHSSLPDPMMVFDMAGAWWDTDQSLFDCPACGQAVSLVDWQMEPEWGFSDFGFEFWNCPAFNDDFIDEMKRRLGCDVWVVYLHM